MFTMKQIRIVQCKAAQEELQDCFPVLNDQVVKWKMKSNIDKCKVMIPGKRTSDADTTLSFKFTIPVCKGGLIGHSEQLTANITCVFSHTEKVNRLVKIMRGKKRTKQKASLCHL